MKYILASKSPRRGELIGEIIPEFDIITSEADETLPEGIHPREGVEILAIRKGEGVAKMHPDAIVISSDTLVELGGIPLGKPRDEADAIRMLTDLSGKAHNVHTGVAIHLDGRVYSGVASTAVYFREMTADEIKDYVASGDPMDKAGSYGIQGGAALFAEKLVGDYYNVVGLPVCRLRQLLAEIAPELLELREDI